METWISDVNDFVSDEADDLSYSVRIAALNLVLVSVCLCVMFVWLCYGVMLSWLPVLEYGNGGGAVIAMLTGYHHGNQ